MNTIVLLLFLFAAQIGMQIFTKLTSKQGDGDHVLYFFLVNSLIASAFFFCVGGCSPRWDLRALWLSLLYAAVIFLSTFCMIKALQRMAIWGVNLLMTAGVTTCTCLIGFLLFSEEITPVKLLRIVLLLLALVLSVLPPEKSEKTHGGGAARALFLGGVVLGGVGNYLTLKLFSMSGSVSSDSDFFLLSNLVLLLAALPLSLVRGKRESRPRLWGRELAVYAGNTLSSNVISLLTLLLIARMEASVYQPTVASLELLGAFSASLLFREKQRPAAYFSVIPALLAVIL